MMSNMKLNSLTKKPSRSNLEMRQVDSSQPTGVVDGMNDIMNYSAQFTEDLRNIHGQQIRTSTANPKLINRISLMQKQRQSGDLSAEQYVQGSGVAQNFLRNQHDSKERAKQLRVSIEKGLLKDNINLEEQRNLGSYLQSLDRRLSIPKHQRKQSQEYEFGTCPSPRSPEKSLSLGRVRVKKAAQNGQGGDHEKRTATLKFGEDDATDPMLLESPVHRRTSTAMNALNNRSFDFSGLRKSNQNPLDLNQTAKGWVR
jgi:hypothetical protein